MNIGFTGHRDKVCSKQDLERVRLEEPGATWVHGGADGFDAFVENFAFDHDIDTIIIRPDYKNNPPKVAPLIRNREIVDMCERIVTNWDGRNTGGTAYTVRYARGKNLPVVVLEAVAPTSPPLDFTKLKGL